MASLQQAGSYDHFVLCIDMLLADNVDNKLRVITNLPVAICPQSWCAFEVVNCIYKTHSHIHMSHTYAYIPD